jgi:hypothetical protein
MIGHGNPQKISSMPQKSLQIFTVDIQTNQIIAISLRLVELVVKGGDSVMDIQNPLSMCIDWPKKVQTQNL